MDFGDMRNQFKGKRTKEKILHLLKANPEYMLTATEISKIISATKGRTRSNLNKLIEEGLVKIAKVEESKEEDGWWSKGNTYYKWDGYL